TSVPLEQADLEDAEAGCCKAKRVSATACLPPPALSSIMYLQTWKLQANFSEMSPCATRATAPSCSRAVHSSVRLRWTSTSTSKARSWPVSPDSISTITSPTQAG